MSPAVMSVAADARRFYRKQGQRLAALRRSTRPAMLSSHDLRLLGLRALPRRLSQAHLAALCGASRSTVSRIERGAGYADPYLYERLLWYVTPDGPKKGPRP